MASMKTYERIGAMWSVAEWMNRPGQLRDERQRQKWAEREEKIKALRRAAHDLPDWRIAQDFPEFRRELFTDADLRRIGFTKD